MGEQFERSERAAIVSQACASGTLELRNEPERSYLAKTCSLIEKTNKQANKTKQTKLNKETLPSYPRSHVRPGIPAVFFPRLFPPLLKLTPDHFTLVTAKMAASFGILRKEMKLTCSALKGALETYMYIIIYVSDCKVGLVLFRVKFMKRKSSV